MKLRRKHETVGKTREMKPPQRAGKKHPPPGSVITDQDLIDPGHMTPGATKVKWG